MIESLINFRDINKKPHLTFIWAFIISTIGIILSSHIAYSIRVGNTYMNLSGLFSVIFTIIPSVYFITYLLRTEEKLEEDYLKKHMNKKIWERHERDLLFFLFYFLGVTFSFALWSFFLGEDFFVIQLSKIEEIRTAITGSFYAKSFSIFYKILSNNLNVLFFSFLFSLIFGAGAVFIIVWNASVLGVYIGFLSRSIFDIPIVSLSFLPHGIPEILGYLCGGLSGGILSAAIIRNHKWNVVSFILLDSLKILTLGVFFIIVAAFIEVFL